MDNLFCVSKEVVLSRLSLPVFDNAGVELAVLRLDKTDHLISGNKWFKLHYHLQQAQEQKACGLVSVGGAHSNHLHALAAAGQKSGLATVGLIRGDPIQTPTINDLESLGMTLHWLSYSEYRERYQDFFWQKWTKQYPDYYLVPEGGGGLLGAKGCRVIPQLIEQQLPSVGWEDFDTIYISVGTGSTLAGVVWGKESRHHVVGCLAIPANYGVDKQIEALLNEIPVQVANYQLQSAARKGFGRADAELLAFIHEVEITAGLLLDPVYTGKTLFFLQQQVLAGLIPRGTRIVFIHTGGLQGRRAILKR